MVILSTLDDAVVAPSNVIYSTAPRTALDQQGTTYYVKGRNDAIAFSEVCGCALAALVGLSVPKASLCLFGNDIYAGVEEVSHPVRNIAPLLNERSRIVNPEDLYAIVAVDTWLGNDDRNLYNVIGSATGAGKVRLFMIDFERSHTLRRSPRLGSGSLEPRKLWPTGELGSILRRNRPFCAPPFILSAISTITPEQIQGTLKPIAEGLPFIDWWEDSVDVLVVRSNRIQKLVEDVWAAS